MLRRFGIALALGLVAVPSQASGIERIETRYDDVVGFYENDGSRYRVTWRPSGGLYLIAIDPEHTSERGGPTMFTVTEDGSDRLKWDDRFVTIERDDGRATSIVARDETGDTVRFTRLTPDPYAQYQVSWSNENVRLVGTVMIPNEPGSHPGVALIQGAGTSGRSNLCAWTFADGLAQRGVATLIPDKRGSDQSEGRWIESDFYDLAGDAAGSLEALRSFEQVDAARTGVVGLSQGGWVAPLAAMHSDSAFCAALVSSYTRPREQVRHELEQDFREADLSESDVRRMNEAIRRFGDYVAGGVEWAHYARFADTLRDGATAELASSYLPADSTLPVIGFWRGIQHYDFPGILVSLDIPRLLIYGSLDQLDNTPVGASLRRLGDLIEENPEIDLDIRVYSRMGHVLGNADTGWISPQVLDELANWIHWRSAPGKKTAESREQ
jgi:pimeloyl-ACP methyl ester carboxylesterase